jgi:hypothetical protein
MSVIVRLDTCQHTAVEDSGRWPPGKSIAFAVAASLVLWAIILSPFFLF